MDTTTLLADIQALIAALGAKSWLTAAMLAIKIAGEIASALAGQQQKPHEMAAAFASPSTLSAAVSQLQSAVSCPVDTINWGNVLTIVQSIVSFVLKLAFGI